MSIVSTFAILVFFNSTIAGIFLLADVLANGRSNKNVFLICGAVSTAVLGAALFLANSYDVGADYSGNEQAAGEEASPILVPRNAENTVDKEQILRDRQNNGVAREQSDSFNVVFKTSVVELWLAFAVAAATVLLAIFGGYQLKFISRQISIADASIEQMRLDNRAWLSLHDVKIKRLQKGYNKLNCTVYVRNSGKTPGRVINGCIRYFVREKDFPQDSVIYEFESLDDDRPTVYCHNDGSKTLAFRRTL